MLNHIKGLVAIDGRCLAGKTTLAQQLSKELNIPYISLDDFFLRKEQRTIERYNTPGENIDHERILEEIIIPFKNGKDIVYRPFDCTKMELDKEIHIKNTGTLILEGSYSFNKNLVNYYDYKIFMDITPEKQLERLKERETEESVDRFINKWIPLEEKYIETYNPKEKADYCLETK